VPPRRICPCWDEADDSRPLERAEIGLLHPLADSAAVRRIHEATPAPRLGEPVVFGREVPRAFGVLLGGTDVEFEAEFAVEGVEEVLRRRPVVGLAGEAGAA
jgi:hypothetical protein